MHSFAAILQEEIQKKTGYIVMRAEGVFDVDANTSIDQLSEDLTIKMPEVHHISFYARIFYILNFYKLTMLTPHIAKSV